MADATPQTTGRVTRRSTRLASKTPQVQCVRTDNPVAKTKAGATRTATKTPRAAFCDISNDVSNSEATSFSTPEPLKETQKQCKTPKEEEEAQPLSLQGAMHDAAEEAIEHNDSETPQDDETCEELKEVAIPDEKAHEEVEQPPVEAPEEVHAAEEAAPEVEEALAEAPEEAHAIEEATPEAQEAEEAPAASVLSGDAQARHLLREVMAKIMPLDTRTEGLEDLYRFTKAYPDYDINKYMAKTKESFRQFIKTSIEEIAMREELQEEELPIAAEEAEAEEEHLVAEEAEEMVDEPMETAEEEEAEDLNEEVEQIEEEDLSEEVEHIAEEELGMVEDAQEEEEITLKAAVEQGAEDEEEPAAELSSPDMPRAPPTTPNPFYEAEDEEILVDFAPTPMVASRPADTPEPIMDCGAQEAAVTPAPAEAAEIKEPVAPQSEAGSDGGFRWLMTSPVGGSTPSQWASNIPMEGSPASGEELVDELQLPGEEALPHQTLKSTVVVPDDFDPRSLRELRKEIAGRTKKEEEVPVERKTVRKEKKPKGAKKQHQQQVVVKEFKEEEKEDDMVTNMSTDIPATMPTPVARVRYENPQHCRFGTPGPAEREEEEAEEWDNEYEEGDEGDECQEAEGLAEMLGGMALEQGVLRGLPAAQGKHIRFDDDGSAAVSPSSRRVPLKGLPQATGKHVFFD